MAKLSKIVREKKRKNKRVLNEKMSVYLDSRLREMREKERERESKSDYLFARVFKALAKGPT